MFRTFHVLAWATTTLMLCTTSGLPAAELDSGAQMIVAPKTDQRCNIDAVPAATLLFPYFGVDLETGSGVTVFTITNADSAPHVARVTLWTNWALPTYAFDVYFRGYEVASFSVGDLLTGKAIRGPRFPPDDPGPLSGDNRVFPGCIRGVGNQGVLRGNFNPDLPIYPGPPFEMLLAAHLGHDVRGMRWADRTPMVWATPGPVDAATGYITVDVVNRCSESFPSAPDYFVRGGHGIASNENVLLGDYVLYEPAGGRTYGDTAVHIRADAQAFQPGDYTFYGRYVDGTADDGRQPLGTAFGTRYLVHSPSTESANTYIVVWRDTKHLPGGPVPSGLNPDWYPLSGDPLLLFDEHSDLAMMRLTDHAPLATQTMDLDRMPVPFDSGWLKLDLNHRASDLFEGAAQGWVTTLMAAGIRSAHPRIHVGIACRAFRLESPCDYR